MLHQLRLNLQLQRRRPGGQCHLIEQAHPQLKKALVETGLSATVTWMGCPPSGQAAVFSATRAATSSASTSLMHGTRLLLPGGRVVVDAQDVRLLQPASRVAASTAA